LDGSSVRSEVLRFVNASPEKDSVAYQLWQNFLKGLVLLRVCRGKVRFVIQNPSDFSLKVD
jgi:hypothetical protein